MQRQNSPQDCTNCFSCLEHSRTTALCEFHGTVQLKDIRKDGCEDHLHESEDA